MANKHKNRINQETGERQVRRSKSDYSMLNETALALFETSKFTTKDIGKKRLSTDKPVSLSAIDKNRFESQQRIGKGYIYMRGNGVYLEFSVEQKIKRVCIAILNKPSKLMLLTPSSKYTHGNIAPYLAIDSAVKFQDRLERYAKKYGYTLELT